MYHHRFYHTTLSVTRLFTFSDQSCRLYFFLFYFIRYGSHGSNQPKCSRMEKKFPYYTPGNKVLIISSEFPPGPGGLGNHAHNLCNTLTNKGVNVHALCSGDYRSIEEIQQFDRNQPFKITRFKRKGIMTYLMRFTLASKIIKDIQPD